MTATENVRCEPSLFPVLLEHAARYSDLDPSRRIGRDTLVRWFEDARVQLGREALAADLADRAQGLVRLRVVAVRVDVLAPLRIAGDYRIGIGVSRVGTSSVSYRYGVFAGDECVATGESTSVYCLIRQRSPCRRWRGGGGRRRGGSARRCSDGSCCPARCGWCGRCRRG